MKTFIFVLIILSMLSCSSLKKERIVEADDEYRIIKTFNSRKRKNDFRKIIEGKSIYIKKKDSLYLTRVNFTETYTAFYTLKVMFDKFGRWTSEIYPNSKAHPYLLWENIKLFKNDTTSLSVITHGRESHLGIYTSILVFDKNKNDLLSKSSKYRLKIIDSFSEMIRNNNSEKRDFYEAYWKTVDPRRWRQIEEYRKNKEIKLSKK